jgi:hypothetical protein
VSREGWDRGVSILHFLGGVSIDLAEDRAIAQTKMTISQRATVHDVLCDVVCTAWTPSIPQKPSRSMAHYSANFPKATVIWLIFNPALAIPSKRICPGSKDLKSKGLRPWPPAL